MKNPCYRSGLRNAGLACGAALLVWGAARKLSRRDQGPIALKFSNEWRTTRDSGEKDSGPSQMLNQAAAVLSFSALTDSALEHYGGCYFNPLMYVAPVVSTLVLGETSADAAGEPSEGGPGSVVFALGMAAGLVGLGFHVYNVTKREGGFSWQNVFYGAPLGSPGALFMAGLLGFSARYLSDGRRAGRVLAGLSSLGMAATVGEAFVLHFRGAFQDPFQYVPVVIPTAAAAMLGVAALMPSGQILRAASVPMKVTALVGLTGAGFHAYGIHRNMGGWHNWSQMILQGPPLPAPLGFTGMALAGLAALRLLEEK